MGTTSPRIDDLIGILQRIDRRLVGIADTLSYDGRLTVVKSIISAIPNYGMCILKLPLGFLDHVDNSSRYFFWKGKDIEQKGKCLVKWENVCKPKKSGGLGVLNLRTQNIALLLKFLFKFMNRQDIPWVQLIWQAHYSNGKIPQSSNACGSFWWKDCLSLLGTFLNLAHCKAGNGVSVRAWLDCWSDTLLSHRFPHLFSFALDNDITLERLSLLCNSDSIEQVFYLPLLVIATQQYEELTL
jgi:hypothetical protein